MHLPEAFQEEGVELSYMKATLLAIWKWVKWPVLVLVFLYSVLVGWRVFYLFEEEKTAEAVAAIHAQKITLADVMGKNLPPVPDQAENDSTVAGVDKNNNGIRDDVELAIFNRYPNSVKVRAAQLQYAAAIQLMLTRVNNSETWIAAAIESSRGSLCIGETVTNRNLEIYKERTEEVDKLVVNTELRREAENRAYDFTTSYSLPSEDICHIDLASLPA